MIHPENCSPAPCPVGFNRPIISQSLFLEFSCANPATPSLRIICFRNFSRLAHAPSLKTPLAPSPACFNHSIFFESLPGPLPVISCKSAKANCSGPFVFEIPLTATIHPQKGAAGQGTLLTALQSRLAAAIESPPPRIPRVAPPQGLTADAGTRHDGSARTSRRGAVGTRCRRD